MESRTGKSKRVASGALMLVLGLFSSGFFLGSTAFASSGLIIHASEFGVGKFHRYDNQVHPYPKSSAWRPYILPARANTNHPLTVNNPDGSVSVFFSTLDDLLSTVIRISQSRHLPVSVLNVHGHGLPGSMWFPSSQDDLNSWECLDWKDAASGSDQDNYDQYYSAVSPSEIQDIRDISNDPSVHEGCTTGLAEWQTEVTKYPEFKSVFAPDAQIHFLSCVVGLGKAGQQFTQGIAQLLLPAGKGRVETSTNFGLGDWSMPEGMGFWDMQSSEQVEHDNEIYAQDKKDREIAQKGTIRVVTYSSAGSWQSTLLGDQDFMKLGFETGLAGTVEREPVFAPERPVPLEVRIPGTTAHAIVIQQ